MLNSPNPNLTSAGNDCGSNEGLLREKKKKMNESLRMETHMFYRVKTHFHCLGFEVEYKSMLLLKEKQLYGQINYYSLYVSMWDNG